MVNREQILSDIVNCIEEFVPHPTANGNTLKDLRRGMTHCGPHSGGLTKVRVRPEAGAVMLMAECMETSKQIQEGIHGILGLIERWLGGK